MSIQFFGQYLLEKGIINPQQLLSAIDMQKEANPPIGQLAIREGYIDEAKASKINREQQRTDLRFGELAISMGYMTAPQIDLLFKTQKEIKKFFGEILVELDFISAATLTEQLAKHAEIREVSLFKFDTEINAQRYSKQISGSIDAIIKNFMRIPKIQVQVSNIAHEKPQPGNDCLIISQTMLVPESIKVGWIMDKPLMQKVANSFLGFDVSDDEEVYIDATCEFLNIILGNALVNNGENQTRLEPPVVELPSANYQGKYSTAFFLTLSAAQQEFKLFFMHND